MSAVSKDVVILHKFQKYKATPETKMHLFKVIPMKHDMLELI
jgi:hypothetical protein